MEKSILSVSFSRGFGLTAAQLGVFLLHRDHPLRKRFASQWDWFTYFYNALAARAFLAIDLGELERVNEQRRHWVQAWVRSRHLPALASGSYYVKSFRVEGNIADYLRPLVREQILRLCFKPPQT